MKSRGKSTLSGLKSGNGDDRRNEKKKNKKKLGELVLYLKIVTRLELVAQLSCLASFRSYQILVYIFLTLNRVNTSLLIHSNNKFRIVV